MKIIGISGSPRVKNTDYMLKTVLDATGEPYEIIKLSELNIKPCTACKGCHQTHRCTIDDDMTLLYEKLLEAEVILLGSPTYFDNVSGYMKTFMDRCLPFCKELMSRELSEKKIALLAVGNLKGFLEFNGNGKSKWIKEETKSVLGCLNAMERFANIIGFEIIEKIYALHSNPQSKEKELIALGKKVKQYV